MDPRFWVIILASVVVAGIIGPATYLAGLDAGRKAQIREVDCGLGRQYGEEVREIVGNLREATFDVGSRPDSAAAYLSEALEGWEASRDVAGLGMSLVGSEGWQALAEINPAQGWKALQSNLLADVSVGFIP